ncbi:FAS1-like dehydratase domain-containing protein [Pararhodobacter sp.]|jgi:acyl dehydratase|uniref:FAS1-like dehydratase domain-containing protein n=1 Tax=Pararhodobacter sp. TaxID=2127056 RepID=UPI002FDEA27A
MSGIAPNPRGLFDRSTVGQTTEPVAFEVEAGRVSFFADVLGETGAIHHDRAAARAAGHPDVVAPPTFAMVVDLEAGRALERQGHKSLLTLIGCDFTRLLHGEERYDYSGLIYAGDCLSIETEVAGFEDKKGGALELAHLRARISHPERGVLVTITRSVVHRLG